MDTMDPRPPRELDVAFIITVTLIHIIYSFKFTRFSLAYLNAQCEEKKSRKKWSTSRLYLHTIQSLQLEDTDTDFESITSTTLWNKLAFIRYLIRILLSVLCCVVLLLYITLQLSIVYEYFVAIVIDYKSGSFLALICFPPLISIIIGIIRYIYYGMSAMWCINVDIIADDMTKEQQRTQIQTLDIYQLNIASFRSPYWMAMHWRLLIVLCSIISTILALPWTIYTPYTDAFPLQIFLRYLCIAMLLWFMVYFMVCVAIALYARITTLSIYNSFLSAIFHCFCSSDAFGEEDTSNVNVWETCKCVKWTVILLSGIVLVAIWNGMLWFIGVVLVIYYAANILSSAKPRGIHCLWHSAVDLTVPTVSVLNRQLSLFIDGYVTTDSQELLIGGQRHNHIGMSDDEDEDKIRSQLYESESDSDHDEADETKLNEQKQKEEEEEHDKVISVFNGLYLHSADDRKSTWNIYKVYWLLILPHNKSTVHVHFYNVFGFVCNGLAVIAACFVLLFGCIAILYASDTVHHLYKGYHWNESNTTISYPLCDLKWNANLSLIDFAAISYITNDIGEKEAIYNTSIQEEICVYFDRRFNPKNCSWNVIYYTNNTMNGPVFVHIRHIANKTDLIAIRDSGSPWKDFSLFNQVALVEMASWIIPITSIFPRSFVIDIVYFMSHFEGVIDTKSRERYDKSIFNYANKLLMDTEYEIDSLYFVGYSFGGGIAQAVAAQINHLYRNEWGNTTRHVDIKSFALGSPGMVFNSKKFSVDLYDLFVTSTVLRPQHDIIANIDIAGGLLQNMESCRTHELLVCGLIRDCSVYQSHNPDLIQQSCYEQSNTFMPYLNQSTSPPTLSPTTDPTADPTSIPTFAPTTDPTADPTSTFHPTTDPTADPTFHPTFDPTRPPTKT